MRNGDTKQNSCDIIANQRKGDYMKSNLEIQEKLYDFIKYIYPVLRQYPKSEKFSLQKDTKNCIMDDFAIAHNNREHLVEVLQKIDAFLGERLKLTLNPKTQIINAKNGFDFCGYRIYKDYRKIRKRSPKHIRATIKAYRSGKITKEKLLMKYASWEGHAKHADTYRLRMKIKGQIEAEIKKKELIGNDSITPDN